MAPETMAHYHDPDTPRATLDPSIDVWSVGIMLLQVLFLQELPRTDPNASIFFFVILCASRFPSAKWDTRFKSGHGIKETLALLALQTLWGG